MRKQQKIINLFHENLIYSIRQVVSISDDEDLNQLWEYIMTVHAGETSKAYDFFVSLYDLSIRFLETHKKSFFEIIIEESDAHYFFTVRNKEFIDFIRKQWKRQRIKYRSSNERISIRLSKSVLKEKTREEYARDEIRINRLLATVNEEPTEKERWSAYTFMERKDIQELTEYIEDMNAYFYEAQSIGLSLNALIRIRSYFSLISLILRHYEQIERITIIMLEFSIMINQHKDAFSKLRPEEIRLIEGFIHNFERWLQVLFVEGGAELHFMDRSFRADIEMIRFMVEPPLEAGEEDLNAIFDF
ncbi:MAG TPA: hypothetical protein VFX68_04415 [Sulfuricurvum sp.]|nr:hypothetical protein [Sulfuricurvum sp.]